MRSAVGPSGRAYVAGRTASADFPTKNPYEPRKKEKTDAFVAVLDSKGSGLSYSSFLGGADAEAGAVAVDPSGKAYIGGLTRGDLPTKDPLQAERKGPSDAFVAKLDPKQSGPRSLVYSTYLGGSGDDLVRGVAVDPKGAAYVTGSTASRDGFPTVAAQRAALAGPTDGFVAKLADVPKGSPVVTGVNPSGGPTSGGTIVTITGSGFDGATVVRFGRVEALGRSVGAGGTKITVRAPPHPDGVVTVTVATKRHTSLPVPAASFSYSEGGWARIAGPARFNHTATLLADGRVLVAGGCVKGVANGACTEPADTAELYDPATRTWAPTPKMQTPVSAGLPGMASHTATLLKDGRVLVIAGSGAQLYDPATGAWAPTGSSAQKSQHSATLLPDGRVLRIDRLSGLPELYDPNAGTWASVGEQMPAERLYHVATPLANGRVLVSGGRVAELFDPATATWTPTAVPEILRVYSTTTPLADGRVLLAGGIDASSQPTAVSEIFDPEATRDSARPEAKGAWSAARSMGAARFGHTATVLPNGKVLVAGGSYEGGRLAGAELFDPASGRWKAAGEMSTPRGGSAPASGPNFTATLLKDGSVLVVGGSEAAPRGGVVAGLGSAELYGSAGFLEQQPEQPPEVAVPAGHSSGSSAWPAAAGAVISAAAVVLFVVRRRRQARGRPGGPGVSSSR